LTENFSVGREPIIPETDRFIILSDRFLTIPSAGWTRLIADIKIVESAAIPKKFTLLNGLPDVGLVGLVAASHIVSSLKMKEVGSVESDSFPPMIVLHDGLPKSPIRLFANESLVVILGETAIPASLTRSLANAVVNWAVSHRVEAVISVGGMAVQNRQDIEVPKVFAALSDKTLEKRLNDGAEVLIEGYIVGAYGLILRKCAEMKVPAITLLTQSYYNYPDPVAAAAALTSLNKILGLKIDASDLLQRGEEIRLRARDVMKRTQTEMARMDKSQEFEVPAMYG
jgi:uncharacterized protein